MLFRLAMELVAAAACAWGAAYLAADLCLGRAPVPDPSWPPERQRQHWQRAGRGFRAAGWLVAGAAAAWAAARTLLAVAGGGAGWTQGAPVVAAGLVAAAAAFLATPVVWRLAMAKQLPHLFGKARAPRDGGAPGEAGPQ